MCERITGTQNNHLARQMKRISNILLAETLRQKPKCKRDITLKALDKKKESQFSDLHLCKKIPEIFL